LAQYADLLETLVPRYVRDAERYMKAG